jgi:hypothetical protein
MRSLGRPARLLALGALAMSSVAASGVIAVGIAAPASAAATGTAAAHAAPAAHAAVSAHTARRAQQHAAFDVAALTARSWTQTRVTAHRVQASLHAKHVAQAAAAARKAAAQAAASGDPRAIAKEMLSHYGWQPSQFSYLDKLWFHESGWQVTATNPSSGAYGIPQSLPASQMASAGRDWRTNPATQVKWGLTYIQGRYGSPSAAWAHELSHNWY